MSKRIDINNQDCVLASNFNVPCPFKHLFDITHSARMDVDMKEYICEYIKKPYPKCRESCDLAAIVLIKKDTVVCKEDTDDSESNCSTDGNCEHCGTTD
jgi:hypothetical protein